MPERIIQADTTEQFKNNMVQYSIETNRKRATPDVRDGLKRVHRRILDSMYNEKPCAHMLVKTAEIVGDVIGRSHPHGDQAVKDAITPLSKWYSCKVPLIYSESNMGNMQGVDAASMRYTEIMLSEFALEAIVADLQNSKEVVDWNLTYNNRSKEPEYFPVAVPWLLINGTWGIGVGMRSEVPPHNLAEVLEATIKIIKDPKAQVVLIPDQYMPCEIIDTNWKAISNKGSGKYIARGIIDIEEYKSGKYRLVIKSTPNQVKYNDGVDTGIKHDILAMVKDGKIPQIQEITEETDRGSDEMRCCIYLKQGTDPSFIRDLIYKTTRMQNTYNVNFEVLKGTELVRMSYKSYLQFFVEQRKEIKFRLHCIEQQKAKTEYHKIEAFVKVMESGYIHEIINLIAKQKSVDDEVIIEYLIKHAKITDIQAKFIINQPVKRLSLGNLTRYKERLNKLSEMIQYHYDHITNDSLILDDIIEELEYFKKKYGQPRKCKVVSVKEISAIPQGNFTIVVTENNYIKKLAPTDPVGAYRGDAPKFVINVENTENILLFSAQGKVFRLPVHRIPVTERNSIGSDIRILLKGLTSEISTVMYEPMLKEFAKLVIPHHIVMITENNYIKKMDIDDFLSVPPSGIIYTKLNKGDSVKSVLGLSDNLDIIIYSDRRALRVNMKEIPKYRRNTIGVNAMALQDGYKIDGISVILPEATDVVVLTESGRVNKFPITGLQRSNRYKAGSSVIKLSKTDKIKCIFGVNDSTVLKIVTSSTRMEVPVAEIPRGSSVSAGTKIVPGKDLLVKCTIK